MANKKTNILLPIAGTLGAIGIYARFRNTGCVQFSIKTEDICGTWAYWLYVISMLFCLAWPIGYVYEKLLKREPETKYENDKNKNDDDTPLV